MKIVLVDDESIVLQGISTIIKRLNRDWSVVAECNSGEDALPVIEQLRPDVVITDIRMYNITGIELAERIKKINQDILVILLTGYSEFDYAQKAIKLNIFDYLLKPTWYNDIIESLSRAETYLGERREKQNFQNALIRKLDENKIALREKFLRDVMKGLVPESVDVLQKCNEFEIDFKTFMVLNVSYESQNKNFGFNSDDIMLMDFIVKNIFSEIINEAGEYILLTENIQNFIVVVENNFLKDSWQDYVSESALRAVNILWEKFEVKLNIGASEVKTEIGELFDCYNQACFALDKAAKNNASILHFQDLKYDINQNIFSKSITEAIVYIDKNYQQDISLREVAEAVYLNVWYLSDLFSREVGMTFSQYIRDKRIARSKELLKDKSLKLYEVAYQVGIKEQGYFTCLFKKVTGLTPKSYREQLEH
jgi:two-component system response regulator YesN